VDCIQSLGLADVVAVQPGKKDALISSMPATMQALELFKSGGHCKGFRTRGDDKGNDDFVFDELDNKSLAAGGTVDCLVSFYKPSTLGAVFKSLESNLALDRILWAPPWRHCGKPQEHALPGKPSLLIPNVVPTPATVCKF
jgi:hypothetical protein